MKLSSLKQQDQNRTPKTTITSEKKDGSEPRNEFGEDAFYFDDTTGTNIVDNKSNSSFKLEDTPLIDDSFSEYSCLNTQVSFWYKGI